MMKKFNVGSLYIAKYKSDYHDTGDIMIAVSETALLKKNQRIELGYHYSGYEEVKFTDKLNGKSFCITGHLHWPREFYKKIIEINGGKFASSVSNNLDYLICDERNFVSTKLDKARQLKKPIITFKEFSNMLK